MRRSPIPSVSLSPPYDFLSDDIFDYDYDNENAEASPDTVDSWDHCTSRFPFNDNHGGHTPRSVCPPSPGDMSDAGCTGKFDSAPEMSPVKSSGFFQRQETQGRRRKQLCPRKSPPADDPDFRGVVFQMRTELISHYETKLHVNAVWHLGNGRKTRCRPCPWEKEELRRPAVEKNNAATLKIKRRISHSGKQCASCGTKTTPLWRDAEDGTSLCNACGIRYKKYRIRCSGCWHIPRKDTKQIPWCSRCGQVLRIPHPRKAR